MGDASLISALEQKIADLETRIRRITDLATSRPLTPGCIGSLGCGGFSSVKCSNNCTAQCSLGCPGGFTDACGVRSRSPATEDADNAQGGSAQGDSHGPNG
jgi:hypothetical protein